jgi:hypothetical protein
MTPYQTDLLKRTKSFIKQRNTHTMQRHEKQRIIQAQQRYKSAKYPSITPQQDSFGYYGKTDTTANGLTSCIIDYLRYEGWQAERISVQGQARTEYFVDGMTGRKMKKVKGVKYTKSAMTKGSADISATINGMSVKIEVKMKDKQSEHQKRYEQDVTRAGGKYWLVHNMTEFFQLYDSLIPLR